MRRIALDYLQNWLINSDRKPLVLRGARQVGKTWLVHELARVTGKRLIELNLEEQPKLAAAFSSNNPQEILHDIEAILEIPSIDPNSSILFIDEIQAVPELLAKLRWFFEKMPELPVITAGSLLEFVLGKLQISMPVGRITYMHLEPLSFEEFLLAQEKDILVNQIKKFNWSKPILEPVHENLMKLFKEYIIVGGMPAAVKSWSEKKSLQDVELIHNDILQTYRDDFGKYSKSIPIEYFNEVLRAIPQNLGSKFVYSQVNQSMKANIIKEALDLLVMARLAHKVQATAANGVPLAGELLHLYIKIIMLDVGLSSAALDLSLGDLLTVDELDLVNKGGIAEQVVGQLLRTLNPFFKEPALYYWVSTDKHASAEIDYVIQHGGLVIPIEVKAGTTGTLKSLHRFMLTKERNLAVRINSAPPRIYDVDLKDTSGNPVQYQLRSIPFYLIGELHRLLD